MLSFHTPWWQRFPDVLERERQGFADAGMEFELDDTARPGQLVVHVVYKFNERVLHLDVVYPHLFPYFRPEISADGDTFEIHQNPLDKRLCMTGDRSAEWYDFETAADLIDRRMPELLADNDNKVGYREGQAAPVSGFFHYLPQSTVIVDGTWTLPSGTFDAKVKANIAFNIHTIEFFRGTVSEIRRRKSRTTFRKMDNQQGHKAQPVELSCPIIVVPELNLINDAKKQLQALSVMHPAASERHWIDLGNSSICVLGVSFKEEITPGEVGQGFQFFLIVKTATDEDVFRVRAQRGGITDIGTRVPQVQGLKKKVITLNGVGALGSPAALEFARNGAKHLLINDRDYFDIATSPRWVFGLPAAGGIKTFELKKHIDLHYPRTDVSAFSIHIGFADIGQGFKVYIDAMTQLFEHTNAIVDFSAEIGVQNFLHGFSVDLGVPFIFASATTGGEGGLVARFMPGSHHGCWYCLQCALHSDEDDPVQHIPPPAMSDDGTAFPAGCTHPTFTGVSFDLQEVTLQTVRMTTQALLDKNADSLVARLGFSGKSRIPVWEEFEVVPRPECRTCNSRKMEAAS